LIVAQLFKEGAYRFPSYYSARFIRFIQASLINEGVLANDPDDIGGKTIFGIASKYWEEDFEVVMSYWKAGKYLEAIEYTIQFYHKNFYSLYYDQFTDESLAFKVFDFGINADPKRAVKALQVVINISFGFFLKVDGILGHRTISAAYRVGLQGQRSKRILNESYLYELYIFELKEFYETRRTFWKFGKGWFYRLRKVYNESKVNGKVKWAYVKTRAF